MIFFFQAEDGIRDVAVTGVQTCALPILRRVAGLETRVAVAVEPGPDLTIRADTDQIEQLLINLVRNGADAVLESGGRVTMSRSEERRVGKECRSGVAPYH